jgi:hypothetical protein
MGFHPLSKQRGLLQKGLLSPDRRVRTGVKDVVEDVIDTVGNAFWTGAGASAVTWVEGDGVDDVFDDVVGVVKT